MSNIVPAWATAKDYKSELRHHVTNDEGHEIVPLREVVGGSNQRIFYMSDMHLESLCSATWVNERQIDVVVRHLIERMATYSYFIGQKPMLLIAGDICDNKAIFSAFMWRLTANLANFKYRIDVAVVLGNHEIRSFEHKGIRSNYLDYKDMCDEYRVYLLDGDILYRDAQYRPHIISYDDILTMSTQELKEKLQGARLAIYGGTGFAGCNDSFNADNGLYGDSVTRMLEKRESKRFDAGYSKFIKAVKNKNAIVLSHMPLKDWHEGGKYCDGIVYVNGHTHRSLNNNNTASYRIYDDNQVAGDKSKLRLKSFLIGNSTDVFSEYADGVYEITGQQYRDFYDARNLHLTYGRDGIYQIIMLKRNGFYCFIAQNRKSGAMAMLDKGRPYSLTRKDAKFYYDNLDKVAQLVVSKYGKYLERLQRISGEVQNIGGLGTIHGCIVDIGFYTHIYANPISQKITPYFAYDQFERYVYKNVPSLLYCKHREMFNTLKDKEINSKDYLIGQGFKNVSQRTRRDRSDIYDMSGKVSKIENVRNGIITAWPRDDALVDVPRMIKSDAESLK